MGRNQRRAKDTERIDRSEMPLQHRMVYDAYGMDFNYGGRFLANLVALLAALLGWESGKAAEVFGAAKTGFALAQQQPAMVQALMAYASFVVIGRLVKSLTWSPEHLFVGMRGLSRRAARYRGWAASLLGWPTLAADLLSLPSAIVLGVRKRPTDEDK